MERLWTRNIEAKDLDPKLMETLRQKSQLFGESLTPIERSHCQTAHKPTDLVAAASSPNIVDIPVQPSSPAPTPEKIKNNLV